MIRETNNPPLPTPDERPDADLVVYDGDCSFCIRQVQRLARWDSRGSLAFVARGGPDAQRFVPDLVGDDVASQMYVVDRQGTRRGGARAVRYLARVLPRLWWIAWLLHLPGTLPLWDWLYRQVAKRRYRWRKSAACDDGTCGV